MGIKSLCSLSWGYRISEKLIDFANDYAKENGFDRTYIPSVHIGLYEKYGYRYLKDIVNYEQTDCMSKKFNNNESSIPTAEMPKISFSCGFAI